MRDYKENVSFMYTAGMQYSNDTNTLSEINDDRNRLSGPTMGYKRYMYNTYIQYKL